MISKTKRLVSTAALGGCGFIINALIALFMTPFMISKFGPEIYGLWMLVASFSGFYGILDLGLSTAVQRYMSRAVGQEDNEEVNNVFSTSLIVFSGLGLLAAILAGSLAWAAPLIVKETADISTFRLVITLCSVNIVIGFPMRSFWGILSSNLRYDIGIYLDSANLVVKTVLIVFFLKFGYGVVSVAAIHLFTDLLWNITNIIYALKIAPYIKFSFKNIKMERLRSFLGYSVYVFISRIADIIKFNIDNYVISVFVNLSAVTVFTVGTRLIGYALSFLSNTIGLMTPVFSQYEGRGDFNSIREKFFFVFKIGIYISVLLGSLLVILCKPFITRWVGVGYDASATIVLIFSVPTVFRMIMVPSDQLLYGTSNHKFLTWLNSSEALANLALSLIFVKFWGIEGVAMGTAVPMVITKAFIQPFYTSHILGVRFWTVHLEMVRTIIKSTLLVTILYLITKNMIAPTFLRIIFFASILSFSYTIILFKIGFSVSEQNQLIHGLVPNWAKSFQFSLLKGFAKNTKKDRD